MRFTVGNKTRQMLTRLKHSSLPQNLGYHSVANTLIVHILSTCPQVFSTERRAGNELENWMQCFEVSTFGICPQFVLILSTVCPQFVQQSVHNFVRSSTLKTL